MNSADDILNPTMLRFWGDFDAQVADLLCHVRLTASEVQNLRHLYVDLEEALQCLAPGLHIKPFGSIVTGLGIKTSDVDCYIQLPKGVKPTPKHVIYARNILRKRFRIFTNLFAITTAKVPIVKFLHIPTNCNCDVNFKSPAGVFNSQLVGHLLHMDPSERALKLSVLIKYWSKVHKLTGTNKLASYALTMMVIFYLQLMNILPPIFELQKHIPMFMVDNWNMAFDTNITFNVSNYDSLYDLLGGFFKCYGNLHFEENIIAPYLGRLLNKKSYENLNDVPTQYKVYKQNIIKKVLKPLNTDSLICIQDPFEHSRNCSIGVYPKLAMKIREHFQFAAKMFDEVPRERFLQVILTEGPTMIINNGKQKTKHLFSNKIMKHKHNQPKRKNYLPHNQIKPQQINNVPQQTQNTLEHKLDQRLPTQHQNTPDSPLHAHSSTQHAHSPQHANNSPQEANNIPTPHANNPLPLANNSPPHTNNPPPHANNPPPHSNNPPPLADNPPLHANNSPPHVNKPPPLANSPPTHTNNPPSQANNPPSHANNSPPLADNTPPYRYHPPPHANNPLQHAEHRPLRSNNPRQHLKNTQRKRRRQNSLIKCYEEINAIRRSRMKSRLGQ